MLSHLWIIPALPFASFLLLALFGAWMPRSVHAALGVGSVLLSALATMLIGAEFLGSGEAFYARSLWEWVSMGDFAVSLGLRLDGLSLLMAFIITFVGCLIHLYSVEFMREEKSLSRFFAYMNLFVAMMLVLVLADNYLLLYFGWEGVGLCSYLLIGYWHKDSANGAAARKAFVVTRIGDVALLLGLFFLWKHTGTLHIADGLARAQEIFPVGSTLALTACLLLLGGAVGKSAQLPLQVWLPDAMAGPTPVSALIHAATMVVAGVYLLARTHVLFALSPLALTIVGAIGAATMLLAGFSALTQWDLKRSLAYSTISQIGLMFLGLGAGVFGAAMAHVFTHAFFKALLFLCAGVVGEALGHHTYDLRKMGGLRKPLPLLFFYFLCGSAALAGFPLLAAGFYSKEAILGGAYGQPWLWAAGLFGAVLTALYSFRLLFLVFLGERRSEAPLTHRPGLLMMAPLGLLAILSLVAGILELPAFFGMPEFPRLSGFLGQEAHHGKESMLALAAGLAAPLLGLVLAGALYGPRATSGKRLTDSPAGLAWRSGWGFDSLYDHLLIRPFKAWAEFLRTDLIDLLYGALSLFTQLAHFLLSATQSGRIRTYAAGIAFGAIILLSIVVISWR